jgi:hypothetical protein
MVVAPAEIAALRLSPMSNLGQIPTLRESASQDRHPFLTLNTAPLIFNTNTTFEITITEVASHFPPHHAHTAVAPEEWGSGHAEPWHGPISPVQPSPSIA